MPRNPDPIGELFDRIRETLTDYAHDMIDDARRKMERPRAPKAKRVSGKRTSKRRAMDEQGRSAFREKMRHDFGGVTLYDDLEVSPHASEETIAAAYRSLAKRYHPDVAKHKSAAERMKQINAAWEILGDEKKRAAYNREIGLRQ